MPLFMSKEKEREYGIYERKEKNVAGDASCCVIVSNLEKKREARKMAKSM